MVVAICLVIYYIARDKFTFPSFELLFLLFVFYVVFRDWRFRHLPGGKVKRGEKSMGYLYLADGITSVIMMQIISVSDSLKGYKVNISVINLSLLLYMFFFNGWFRNKVIGVIIKSKEKEEGGNNFHDKLKFSN
jgi:hypothetical protein